MSNFNLANHAVLVAFNATRPKQSRVDKVLTNEAKKMAGINPGSAATKKTITSVVNFYGDELAEVEAAIWLARKDHYRLTLDYGCNGMQLLPAKAYMQYVEVMRAHKAKVSALVNAIDYPAMLQRRAEALAGAFHAEDYPGEATFRASYGLSVSISPVPDSNTLSVINGMVDHELSMLIAENEQRIASATEAAMKDLWTRLYEAVKHLADKYAMGNSGRVHDSDFGNLNDLVNLLPAMNMTDDPALTDLTNKLRDSLCKVNPDSLTKNELAQKDVAKKAQAIMDQMAGYMGLWS